MSQIEEPDPRWRAIIGEWCDSFVETLGAAGYVAVSFLSVVVAAYTSTSGEMGPLFGRVMDIGQYLFVLGFCAGAGLAIAASLYGEDGGNE